MNKSNFKQIFLTLALLITAATGAWADGVTASEIDATVSAGWGSDESLIKASDLPGYNKITLEQAMTWASAPASGTVYLIYEIVADGKFKIAKFEDGNYTDSFGWSEETHYLIWEDINYSGKRYFYTTGPAPAAEPGIKVTTDAAEEGATFTEASFQMQTFDVDVNYTLVRDMQDQTNPVAFTGLPSSGNIVVKKGDDGKYQPAETLTLQLIDPLAAAEAQNIIAADGITVKVGEMVPFDIEGSTYYQLDKETLVPLADFLADMKPGLYKMVAESTDENSPYDGTVYSAEFTTVEKYDLTVKPASDFSKNGLDAVTVGSQSVTIDANTGEATKTGIDPNTEVKIKAKRGYIIDKVEAKKTSTPN